MSTMEGPTTTGAFAADATISDNLWLGCVFRALGDTLRVGCALWLCFFALYQNPFGMAAVGDFEKVCLALLGVNNDREHHTLTGLNHRRAT